MLNKLIIISEIIISESTSTCIYCICKNVLLISSHNVFQISLLMILFSSLPVYNIDLIFHIYLFTQLMFCIVYFNRPS